MDVFDFCWGRPGFDTGNFYWVHASHPLFKNYPQVIDARDMKTALGELDKQVMRGKKVQGVMHHCNVVSDGGASTDDDIIHVDTDDCCVKHVSQ